MLAAEQLWSPPLAHWFGGWTPQDMRRVTCRQIIDMYRFVLRNLEQ